MACFFLVVSFSLSDLTLGFLAWGFGLVLVFGFWDFGRIWFLGLLFT